MMPTTRADSSPESQTQIWSYVFFLGIAATAVALRVPELGSKGLWLDEAHSIVTAQLPVRELLSTLSREATPPLYYLLLKPWLAVAGSSEAAARALSVLFSIGGIAMMALLARRFFSLRIASVATLMLTFTPLHIYYAQEARMYSLLALLGTALVFFSLDFRTTRSVRSLALAGLLSVAMLLTHSIAAWFVIGVNVAFLALSHDRFLVTRWLAAQLIAGVCYLPWLVLTLERAGAQGDVLAWFGGYWSAKSVVGHFMTSIGSFALGSYPPYLAIQSPLETAPFLRSGVLLLMCFGLFRWWRDASARFVATALFVALVLGLMYSAFFHPVHIPGRTDQALLPLCVLLVALGIDGLKPRLLEGAVLLVGMMGSLVILQIYRDFPEKNHSRAYLWELQGNLRPGDVVVTTGLTWSETSYYLERWGVAAEVIPFPQSVREHPGYINYRELRRDPARLYADAEAIVERSKQLLKPGSAIFLIYMRPLNVNGIVAERLVRDFPSVIEIGAQPFRQSLLGHRVRILRMQAAAGERPGVEALP